MIRVRYRGSTELSPGLHATAERAGRRTTVYLLDGMTALSGGAGPSQVTPAPSTPATSAPASAPASTPAATAPAQSGSGSSSGSGSQGSGGCVNVGPLGVCLNI